jgi:hypothetical protein
MYNRELRGIIGDRPGFADGSNRPNIVASLSRPAHQWWARLEAMSMTAARLPSRKHL